MVVSGPEDGNSIALGARKPFWLESGDLSSESWVLLIADPKKIRPNLNRTIHFNVAVAPGISLVDPQFSHDLATIKTILAQQLDAGTLTNESAAVQKARSYIQFVRWRVRNRLYKNADLTQEWFERLFEDLRNRGIAELLPYERNVLEYTERILCGEAQEPVVFRGANKIINLSELLFQIGCSNTLQLDADSRLRIRELATTIGATLSRGAIPENTSRKKAAAASSFASFLRMLDNLWSYRESLPHDPLRLNPLRGQKALVVARKMGASPVGRTRTVPARLMCTLIDQALNWVLDYSDTLLNLKDALTSAIVEMKAQTTYRPVFKAMERTLSDFDFQTQDSAAPWPMIPEAFARPDHTRPTAISSIFHLLPAACAIVIAAFSARRSSEIQSLRFKSCQEVGGIYYLNAYSSKYHRDLIPVPVPVSVYKAMSVLERIAGDGVDYVFDFKNGLSTKIYGSNGVNFDIYACLKKFAQHVGTGTLEDGTVWVPKPHDVGFHAELSRFFHREVSHL